MSKLLLLLISAILSAALMWAHEEAKLTPGQREVVNVHNTMREAARSRDFGAWSAYVADDCIFTTDDGEITTKAKIIQHMRSMPQADDHSEDLRDFVVHVYGDTAVLNVRFTAHEQFNLSDIVTEMREMETFYPARWLVVAGRAAMGTVADQFPQARCCQPEQYKDYAGSYEWRPGGPVDTVSLRDGKLLTRLNDEPEENEYLPLSEETFFLKDDLGTVTFVRDALGHVNGYTYRRPDSQEIHVKKIK